MREMVAELLRQGGSLISMLIRTREVKRKGPVEERPQPDWMREFREDIQGVQLPQIEGQRPKQLKASKESTATESKTKLETPESAKSFEEQTEAGYRAECLQKHFSTARGIIKEGIDRAVDQGMGDAGVIQKIREAMESINSAEPDVAAMIPLKDVKEYVDFFDSGMRNLRKAVFEARLETGGGSLDDLKAMHTWTGILLNKAYDMAKEYPGTECERII